MSLLLLGIAVGVLALVLRGTGTGATSRASAGALLIAYGAPAVFLAWTLFSHQDEARRFRFALLGLGFRGEVGSEFEVPIGGERDRHAVWISALADDRPGRSTLLGHLGFQPPEEEGVGAVGTLRFTPAPSSPAGLLGVRAPRAPIHPLRSVELVDGDRLSVGDRSWEVEFDTGLLGPPAALVDAEGHRVELPKRLGRLPLGIAMRIWRLLPATFETYPLAWLEKAAGGELADPRPLGFFFWENEGLVGSRLWLWTPDPSVAVERAGAPLAFPSPELPAGAGIHVLSHPRWSENGFTGGGIRDRRSFRLFPGRRSFALMLETPEVHVLPPETLAELAIEVPDTEAGDPLRFNLSMGGWQVTDKSLHFRHSSRKVALEALATLELAYEGEGTLGDAGTFSAATPRGQRRGRLGEPVWLGGDNLAGIQIDVLSPPLVLGILALGLALLKVMVARSVRLSVAHLFLAAPLEALVALRVLLGYRVWALPPFKSEALELAMIAWALLPWAFLIASAPASEDRRWDRDDFRNALPALGGWVFCFGWCWSFGEGIRVWVWVLCLAAALGVWVLRISGGLSWLMERSGRWLAREWPYRKTLWIWVIVALVPGLVRLGLLFLGNRESLLLGGQRFALTLVHVPVAILLEAAYLIWLWQRMADEQRLVPADLIPAAAILGGTWVMPALLVSDLGLALLNVPVFLVALSSVTLIAGFRLTGEGPLGRRQWLLYWTPAAVLGFYLVFAAFPVGARLVIGVLPKATEWELESERNFLRLLAFAYPGKLEQVARRESEELTIMSTVMRSYTSGPFTGRGYCGSELSPHIEATALREHAPSVFVAAEWGLAGILGVLLLFLVASAGGLAFAVWRGEAWAAPAAAGTRFWGAAASLAALTLGIPSLYMILANYRLTLFTGKNAYLLGLDSTADVLEVFVLAVLCALGAAALRDEEAAI